MVGANLEIGVMAVARRSSANKTKPAITGSNPVLITKL
jgi:hypothetical protein